MPSKTYHKIIICKSKSKTLFIKYFLSENRMNYLQNMKTAITFWYGHRYKVFMSKLLSSLIIKIQLTIFIKT